MDRRALLAVNRDEDAVEAVERPRDGRGDGVPDAVDLAAAGTDGQDPGECQQPERHPHRDVEHMQRDQVGVARAVCAPLPSLAQQVDAGDQQDGAEQVDQQREAGLTGQVADVGQQRQSTGHDGDPGVVPAEDRPGGDVSRQVGGADDQQDERQVVVGDAAGGRGVDPVCEALVDFGSTRRVPAFECARDG